MNGWLDFISIIDFSVFPIMVMSCWPALVRKCHAPPCCLLFFKKYLFNASYNKQNFLIAGPFQKFLWSPNWLPRGLPDSWTYMLPLTDSQVGNLTPRFSKTDSLVGDLTPSGARVLQRFIGPWAKPSKPSQHNHQGFYYRKVFSPLHSCPSPGVDTSSGSCGTRLDERNKRQWPS